MSKKSREKKMSKWELLVMFRSWLESDVVKSGHNFNTIERRNEAFARGWRWAMLSAINKLEENA